MNKEGNLKSSKNSSNIVVEFFASFALVFKYVFDGVGVTAKAVTLPFTAVFNSASKQAEKATLTAKTTVVEASSSEPKKALSSAQSKGGGVVQSINKTSNPVANAADLPKPAANSNSIQNNAKISKGGFSSPAQVTASTVNNEYYNSLQGVSSSVQNEFANSLNSAMPSAQNSASSINQNIDKIDNKSKDNKSKNSLLASLDKSAKGDNVAIKGDVTGIKGGKTLAQRQAEAEREKNAVPTTFGAKFKKLMKTDLTDRKISKKELASITKQKKMLADEFANASVKRLDHGVTFKYKALTNSGKVITGTLYGFSKMDVNTFLISEGYEPFEIVNNKWIDLLYGSTGSRKRKMKMKDLIFFLTQLTTYIKAGISLTDSMKILMNQSGRNKSKQAIYQSVVYELTLGNSFSEALDKQGNIFPPLLVNMIKAAEATGDLEETLDDMVEYYTDVESTRKEMISALTYPSIISVFAVGVVVFILIYVIPQFSEIYTSMEVDIGGMTLFLLNLSQFLKKYIFLILIIIAAIIAAIVFVYKNIKAIRRPMQILFMKIPVLGNIIIYNEITIFSKTFSSLLKNNVNITESIDILSKITNNEIYKEIMISTINNIAVGDRISEAFKDQWAVPEVAYYMIVTGESTGQLAEMLNRVAKFYQEQHHNMVSALKSLIEPIVIMVLAVLVGGIIIAVIVPMFDMYGSIAG